MDNKLLELYAQKELAKRDFFWYCNTKAPDFYKANRRYLVDFCHSLQDFYQSDNDILIVNLPPRHGKSRTIGCFVEWVLGKNQNEKIMTGSYNELLSTNFSKSVRDTIMSKKADQNRLVYSDIFPNVAVKRGDGAMNLWSLENGYNNYLATSPTGTATGFGASILIIDDLIKSALEANTADILQKHWEWFTNTMLSRLEENAKIIIVMTRWHSQDLAGRALNHYKNEKLTHILYKALNDDGSMLCDEILSLKSFNSKKSTMGIDIVEANYQQNPIDLKGRLYSSFKTYTSIPTDTNGKPLFTEIRNYTDTADTGSDFLCSINYGVFNNEAYVLDLIYTKDSMELTEPAVAKMIYDGNVNVCDIESNNGGRGFSRNIESILKNKYRSNRCSIKSFFQSKNKKSRILSNSTWVMEHVYFPSNWNDKFPDYYKAMSTYQKEGKNAHDDAPDATTGITERINTGSAFSFD